MSITDFPLFDAHFHVIDPRFPLVPNRGYLPDRYTVSDYRERMKAYDLRGGAVISGSFQAFDQDYLVDALQRLGPAFVGVTQLPASVTDEELRELHEYGVRAVRFNPKRGGSEDISRLDEMARRIHELLGWHAELYIDAFSTLGMGLLDEGDRKSVEVGSADLVLGGERHHLFGASLNQFRFDLGDLLSLEQAHAGTVG